MSRIALIAVAWAASQGGIAAPLTPGIVQREIAVHGAKATVDDLWRSKTWYQVENGIAAGSPAWIRLAPLLADGTDAGTSEGLGQSLIEALPKAPEAVLAALDTSGRSRPLSPDVVCGASFPEGDRTDLARYRARATGAVRRVDAPALVSARRACLARLREPGR